MEIRVNKLVRELYGNSSEESVSKLAEALMISDLSVNTKLSINAINSGSDIVDMNRLDGCEMMELYALKNRIESAIEKKEAIIQLEGALQRLAFVGIKEIAMNGYFVSHMEEVVASSLNVIV